MTALLLIVGKLQPVEAGFRSYISRDVPHNSAGE